MRKALFFAFTLLLGGGAMADQVKSLSELALLPAYCSGTQTIRSISGDPKPIEEYVAIYGQPYTHLHHYCWALNAENNAWRIRDSYLRKSKLTQALGDIQYLLARAGPDFILLPEILNSQARILFTLRRDAEAINALNKAISIKPDYSQAYERLSDYYVDNGNKSQAIAILERGIGNTENASRLIKRLEKLGKTYPGVPGELRIKKDSAVEKPIGEPTPEIIDPTAPPQNSPTPTEIQPKTDAEQGTATQSTDESRKANPYCRFCP